MQINNAGALKALASAQENANLIKDVADKSSAWTFIAEAQAKTGDIAGANEFLASAQNFADLIKSESYGGDLAQSYLAEARARRGDIARAQKNAELIRDKSLKSRTRRTIAEAKAKAGNVITPNLTRQSASAPAAQPLIRPSDWLEKLDDADKINDNALNTGPFLDLAGYLKSLPPSSDPSTVFRPLYETAETIVTAQNVIAGMLKQQAKR